MARGRLATSETVSCLVNRWRATFLDAVSARRIEVDVAARNLDIAREAAWVALRASRPTGLVVVELVDVRPADDTIPPGGQAS